MPATLKVTHKAIGAEVRHKWAMLPAGHLLP